MTQLDKIERLLDSNRLEVQWQNGKWYSCRRNGQTRRWKRDTARFAIPIKIGFRDCFTIATDARDMPNGGHFPDSPYLREKI